jgi:hypothetical protein
MHWLAVLGLMTLLLGRACQAVETEMGRRFDLSGDWQMQSAARSWFWILNHDYTLSKEESANRD